MRMKNESFYRQKIERLLLRADRAQSADALLAGMKIKKADRPAALLALQRMEAEGRITRNKKGKYALSAAQGKRGRILSLSKGFAFARMEDGGPDCFIPGRYLKDALPGDTVRIREGAPADITLYDLDKSHAIDPETFLSMGRATPFAGWEVRGECAMTICKGEAVWNRE